MWLVCIWLSAVTQPSRSPPTRVPQRSARKLDPPLLTAKIKQSKSLSALIQQYDRHGGDFNHIHCSAFWARAGQLGNVQRSGDIDITDFETVLRHTESFVDTKYGRRELAGTAHGLAKVGLGLSTQAQPLWSALAATSTERLDEFTPRELPVLAWALAKARLQTPESNALFDSIAKESIKKLSGFSPQGLANLAWSFATAGRAAPELFTALATVATQRAADFNPQETANICWAFAALARPAPEFFNAIAAAARPRLEAFAAHELAMLGWAFAVVDAGSAGDVLFGGDSPFVRECEAAMRDEDNAGSFTQLHQWSLWRLERGGAWPGFTAAFGARCRNAFFSEGVPPPSGLETCVQVALRRMGLSTQQKVRTREGYVIDLYVESDGGRRQVSVEVDGPGRFLGWSREATGATLLKRRQLRFFGYRLMSIPYWEWEQLNQQPTEEQRYLTLAIAVRTGVRLPVGSQVDNAFGAPLLPKGVTNRPPSEILPFRAPAVVEKKRPELDRSLDNAWGRSLLASDFGAALDIAQVCDRAASKRICFCGEVYAQRPVIAFEVAVLRRMLEQTPRVCVVMEHFNQQMQPLLDSFVAGERSFEELVDEYARAGDEGHDLRAYEPLLRMVREHAEKQADGAPHAKLIGGFLPRSLARSVVADGLEASLEVAKERGFVRADEIASATEEHYAFFEALCSGRAIHDWAPKPTGLARRLFPAQVLKGCSMAHAVNRVVEAAEEERPEKVLVCCGASHMAFGFGVPERVFAAHPELRDESYSVYAYKVDDEKAVLEEEGLREVFIGSSSADRGAVSDVAFCFDDEE